MQNSARIMSEQVAPLTDFELVRGRILSGDLLRKVRSLRNSIERFGLLTPFTVIPHQNRLFIVDGRKRIAALRCLSFEGRLAPSLYALPYIVPGESLRTEVHTKGPQLTAKVFAGVLKHREKGHSIDQIMHLFDLDRRAVWDVLSLSALATELREAFFDGLITLDQAQAFAALPSVDDQVLTLRRIGPFVSPREILERAIDPV